MKFFEIKFQTSLKIFGSHQGQDYKDTHGEKTPLIQMPATLKNAYKNVSLVDSLLQLNVCMLN